jgi:hypothetical protein
MDLDDDTPNWERSASALAKPYLFKREIGHTTSDSRSTGGLELAGLTTILTTLLVYVMPTDLLFKTNNL